MGEKIEFIFYVLFIGFLIFLYLFKMKGVKKLNLKMEQNPELKEKLEIEKSKRNSYRRVTNKSLKIFKESPLLAFLFVILVILLILILFLTATEESVDTFYLFSMIVLVIILVICIRKRDKYTIKSSVFDALIKRYGEVETCEMPEPKIVQGEKSEVGNIRNKYIFSHRVLKFNCLFSNYVEEKLVYRRHSYVYIKKRNFVVYNYDLKKLGLTNINDSILSYPSVKQVVEDLNKIKIFNISIQNDTLIIEKETILNYYEKKDLVRDIDDVKLFYNKIVKEIIREAK